MEFNQRVLDQASDRFLPLLERLKFLAITGSNLDEFFMVRVGSLIMLNKKGDPKPDMSGLSPIDQLMVVRQRAGKMIKDQYDLFLGDIESEMAAQGICRHNAETINTTQLKFLEKHFRQEVLSVMTPIAAETPERFPQLFNLSMALCVRLKPHPKSRDVMRFRVIPLGRSLSRFVSIPGQNKYDYVTLEQVSSMFVQEFFPGETVLECVTFRITRNADFDIHESDVDDLMEEMEEIIDARNQSECVRLEISDGASELMVDYLRQCIGVAPDDIYQIRGPLELSSFMRISQLTGFSHLREESWESQPSPLIEPKESMFEAVGQKDILLLHPYQSFDPIVNMIQEAADDKDVLAIKQTLYRTSRDSGIVNALIRAAERGKYVTAIVELKARFDEARNIDWASKMEQAGVYVLYGVKGLKTHAKVCVIIRREPAGIKRYVHFGTGNYNEATSRLYTDVSLLTSNDDLGEDAVNFFNAITGDSLPQRFHKIEAAPFGLRQRLVDLIHLEIKHAEEGHEAFIRAKVNSLVDPELIKLLYKASQAGVTVQLNVRGICCLRPGVPGLSDKIQVVSVIDRFLEHARVIHFHHGGDDRVLISSADWMPRNLDRRIELLVPIEDPASRDRLIQLLQLCMRDRFQGRQLQADGSYTKLTGSHDQLSHMRSQEFLQKDAERQHYEADKRRSMVMEPHHSARE
jgi:polyphosphate kinase